MNSALGIAYQRFTLWHINVGGYGSITSSCSLSDTNGIKHVAFTLSAALDFNFLYILNVQTAPIFRIVFSWF